ncbi:MAG: DegT/DnrJ/EryC1/StrS family aminotransferase [Sedimentisphaerales bacterium]|nr:DegT/DnrJ/EryC1/StrS family aminotransferase [Sedimentisphaerales bacterium]
MKTSYSRRSFLKKTSAALAITGGTTGAVCTMYAQATGSANVLALFGGTPVRTKSFSTNWPIFDQHEEKALLQALRSRNWCCLRGNVVYDFEKNFARDMGVQQCVLSNGGTTALGASLQCLGVGAGDEVITSPHTFIATINVITNLHALPVFVDIDPDTGSIDAGLIEAAITENTKAIVPVHLGGFPADIQRIMSIAKKHDIPVVEDACQSVYAEVDSQKVGTFGATGCISFQEWKTLVSGEGGAILGNDQELMRHCAGFVNNGRDPERKKSGYPFPGSNHRMTEFQAAVLTEQYKRFKEQDQIRQKNGRYVEEQLTQIPGLRSRKRYSPNTRITYFYFELDYDHTRFAGVSASDFAKAVRAEGIPISGGTRQYHGGCHREGMLEEHLRSRGFERVFSKARLDHYRASLRLPIMDGLTENKREMISADTKIAFLGSKRDMDDIIEAFHKVVRNIGKLAKA